MWRRWGSALSGLGVDAIIEEVERLKRQETNKKLVYSAARVGVSNKSSSAKPSTYALHRSSAYLAAALLSKRKNEPSSLKEKSSRKEVLSDFRDIWRVVSHGTNVPSEANYSNHPNPFDDPFFKYYFDRFSEGKKTVLSSRLASVDELAKEAGLSSIDFLKIDTDGYELDVLKSSCDVLKSCLGVEVEVQFQGPVSDEANVFCNIDRFLREKGFYLVSLQSWKYSRSALPKPFCYSIPAQTECGPIAWGDALYLRDVTKDVGNSDYNKKDLSQKLQNAVLLCDLYGLEDVSAEIILENPGLFCLPDDEILDFLAKKVYGPLVTYKSIWDAFFTKPIDFHKNLQKNRTYKA